MEARKRRPHRTSYGVLAFTVVLSRVFGQAPIQPQPAQFMRGDANQGISLGVEDAITILGHLFVGAPAELDCEDAADATDDGSIDLGDAVFLIYHLYGGGDAPPKPFPACGEDPTIDFLSCERYWACGTGVFVNSIGMTLLPVPAGTFEMGSRENERGRSVDEVLHTVVLACPFYMSETEVTQLQYLDVIGENPSYYNGHRLDRNWGKVLTRPVESVTWEDAEAFCRRLSLREGRKYRLPYEAEWEYVCRAGTQARFWFGDVLECADDCPPSTGCVPYCSAATAYMYFPGDDEDGGAGKPVRRKTPNWWGFYGFDGWLSEWCFDWYGPYPVETVVNPTGPNQGTLKVFRGRQPNPIGMRVSRSAKRGSDMRPVHYSPDLGFRVVVELPTCSYGD